MTLQWNTQTESLKINEESLLFSRKESNWQMQWLMLCLKTCIRGFPLYYPLQENNRHLPKDKPKSLNQFSTKKYLSKCQNTFSKDQNISCEIQQKGTAISGKLAIWSTCTFPNGPVELL